MLNIEKYEEEIIKRFTENSPLLVWEMNRFFVDMCNQIK